jgi:trimeric autotransporter adhesin
MKRGLNKENSLPDPEFGGESSESARAIHYVVQKDTLMTYVSARFAQADPGIVSGSTTERKQMSTKTSFKRIALVAVSALGIGVLTSVSPAHAAAITTSVPTVGAPSANANIGASATVTVGFTTGAATTVNAADTFTSTTVTISAPSGSGVTLADNNGSAAGTTAAFGLGSATATLAAEVNSSTGAVTRNTAAGTVASLAAGVVVAGTVTIVPDVAGVYRVVVTTSNGATATHTLTVADLFGSTADGLTSGNQTNTAINGVAGAFNNVTLTVRTVVGQRLIAVTGSTISAFTTGADSTGTIATDRTTMVVADAATAENATFTVATPTVGTITVRLFDTAQGGIFRTTASGEVVITVNAAAQTGAVDTALTTATLSNTGANNTALASVNAAATTLTAPATSGLKQGQLAVAITTVAGSLAATTVKTATITGPGYLVTTNNSDTGGNSTGRSLISVGTDNDYEVSIHGDGSTGTSTVTVTAGAYTKTITVVFYGTARTLTATQVLNRASTAGAPLGDTASATTAAATVRVVDATGNPVVGVTPTVVSATTSVIASGSCSASSSTGVSFCSVTSAANTAGKTASVTFKTVVSGVDVVSNPLTFTLGGALSRFTWAFGKTSYAPGERMTITITGVDSTGAPTFDGSKDIFATAITPSASTTYSSTADLAGVDFVDGKGTITMFAPLSAGPFSVTAGIESGFQTAMGATSATVSTTVSDSASMSAITTLINSLIAKINALNKLVVKIQKKVRA